MCHIVLENKDGYKVTIGYVETSRDEQASKIELVLFDILEKRFLKDD